MNPPPNQDTPRQHAEVVVLGARGQLAQAFLRRLGPRAVGFDRTQVNVADPAALQRALAPLQPRWVINCAAYNHVDLAEAQHQAALAANAEGPAALAALARAQGWQLLHFSSDYVYGADLLQRPRAECDPPAPLNFYGHSKLIGEQAVLGSGARALVVRVAHLYGGNSGSPGRANLVQRFLEIARAGQPIRVLAEQWLNPTSVQDVVDAALQLLEREETGLFHLAGEGHCTAAEFARAVLASAGIAGAIETFAQDVRPAPRPRMSALENRRWSVIGMPPLPHWRAALARYLAHS